MDINGNHKKIVLALVVAILVGIVAFVYWSQNQLSNQAFNDNSIQTPPTEENVLDPSNKTATSEKPADNRIVLTPANVEKYFNEGCDPDFNFDEANETFSYSNSARGISIQLPYNSKWGDDKFKLTPYDDIKTSDYPTIQFGRMGVFEGGGCARGEFITFLPIKSAQARIAEIKKEHSYEVENFGLNPEVVKINSLDVIKYETGGLCAYPTMEVIGKKHIYKFNHLCEGNFESFETMIKTIKLLP